MKKGAIGVGVIVVMALVSMGVIGTSPMIVDYAEERGIVDLPENSRAVANLERVGENMRRVIETDKPEWDTDRALERRYEFDKYKSKGCPDIVCVRDPCPGRHLPDKNGCINCASPCKETTTTVTRKPIPTTIPKKTTTTLKPVPLPKPIPDEPECTTDNDCPQIVCVMSPCPYYICHYGKCKLMMPEEPPTEPSLPKQEIQNQIVNYLYSSLINLNNDKPVRIHSIGFPGMSWMR